MSDDHNPNDEYEYQCPECGGGHCQEGECRLQERHPTGCICADCAGVEGPFADNY